jgi:hypothetical protein
MALAIFLFAPAALQAAEKLSVEVWLIDTRCAPVCGDWEAGKAQIAYWRLDENRHWVAENATTFAENSETSTPTIFLVHGNRTTNDEAVEFAWPIYCWLSQLGGERSYRVAIWSWPSERTDKRQRRDVQAKVAYCDSQSYYLADCLRQMKANAPISLVGYSLGARIISGSLQLCGGGTLACHGLPEFAAGELKPTGRVRAALIADASDCFVLAPGGRNELAASQAEEILVTRNVCDTALRWYPRLYGRGGPEAMGFIGPCCFCPANVRVFDATCCVGRSHSWEDYIYCPHLFATMPRYLFADEK